MAGASVYGVTLILMVLCSALYHLVRRPGWGQVLLRLDHAAIFLKIAGTYTAFSLIAGEGYGLTAALWGAAAVGVALEVLMRRPRRALSTALALGMGWAVVAGGGAILAALPTAAVVLMAVGGALYTAGAVFNHWRRLPFHNTIWHGFVLAATAVFYAAVVVAVVAA
ncbi:MAG: hemolysin III family protein [Rhodobacteraceae bacterium]|nr:hemolysin III family protein [Paracoccaceae bacterium]